ncbi:MAG: aldo/keto reductase [Thermoguttaceae bacterium]
MDIKRRQFLGGAALGTGAVLSGQLPFLHADEQGKQIKKAQKPVSSDPVALVPLTENIWCSRIGFGCGMRGGNRDSNLNRLGMEKATELVRFAYDNGIRMFDMADLYGSHPVISTALKDKPRDSYVLVSKIWGHPGGIPENERPEAEEVVKRFLKECKTDYLDVVQIHCMMNGEWTKQYEGYMEGLEKLKKQGLIRAHGVSCHANAAIALAAKTPWTDVVHVRINPEGVNMEGTVEEVVELTNQAHDAGIGTIAMKIIGEGKFADSLEKRKASAKFVANLDCVDVMIVGFEDKGQVTEFIDNVAIALKK